MVQLFYYETRGKGCKKLFRYEGYPEKILLFPYEGWARPAALSFWTIKMPWWSNKRCKIVENCGTKKITAKGRFVDHGNGAMFIVGKFKDKGAVEPDFKLQLTTSVSNTDFQLGYSMTGTLERGDKRSGNMEMTHYAMIKRKGY